MEHPMDDDLRLAEDLSQTAQDAFYLASRLCVSCRDIHAVRPYIRLSRGSTGMETETSGIGPVMTDLIGAGRRRVLIAGALDTGILACVARAAEGHQADIVVLDICATPLELCRKYAERWSLHIETVCEDLAQFERERDFDIVLIDGTLPYIPEHSRVGTLRRIARALEQDGRLVLLFKTRIRTADGLAVQNIDGATRAVLSELHRLGVALPEPDESFAVRLKAFARGSAAHTDAFSSPEEVDALLDSAGFAIETRRQIDLGRGGPKKSVTARNSTHRYLVIASCGTNWSVTGSST
jgi:ubiquinone/menaquinone biosynthesis C-methylase UbiE